MTMAAGMLLSDPLVKELIFCKLCNKFFDDPRVLPCQHTFCMRCLQEQFQTGHASARTRLSSLRCPQCYTTAAIPTRGIHMFPSDHKVDKIKELVDKIKGDSSLVASILRKSRIDILEGHRRGGGSKSRPSSWTGNVDVTELGGEVVSALLNNTSPMNVQHAEKEKREPDTKEAATDTGDDDAGNFVFNNHEEAHSVNLEECGIQTDLCDITKYVGYEVVLTDNGDNSQSARKRTSNARINQNGVPLSKRTCPSSNIKGLHHQVAHSDKNDHKSINQDEGSSELSDAELEGNSNDIIYSAVKQKSGNKKAHALKKETTLSSSNAECANNVSDDQVDCAMADNMASEHVNGEQMENHESDETDSVDHSQQPLPVYTTPPELQWSLETQEYNMPTCLALASNGNVVVAEYGNCKIQMFESDGTYVVSVDDVKPYALAIASNNDIVVADRKDRTVKVYGEIGDLKYAWENDSFYWISGLSITSQGNVVVYDREDCKLGVFSPEGEKIRQFGHYGDGDSQLCMADFLAVDGHDRILVCDSGHHCIKIYDTNGSFLGRFGERGTSEGYLLWPKSVCVDSANNILVTDQKNNRVSLYSPDGVFIQTLIPSYTSPFGICYASPDTLGLTSFNLSGSSCVSFYKL